MASDRIIRRDFLNRSLLGAGAALLKMPAPALAAGDTYTGYAGVGITHVPMAIHGLSLRPGIS